MTSMLAAFPLLRSLMIFSEGRLASRYDGTVRNSTGAVVQFLYGEDGMDGTAIESQRVEHLRMDAQRFRVRAPLLTLILTLLAHALRCDAG